MAVIWIYTIYFAAALVSVIWADENEHIHIKLHLPEVLKKHTQVKTVYKHHYHPKKTTNAHLIKGSFGKFEPEGSYSMLNPVLSLPKPNAFPPSLELPSNSWLSHGDGLAEILGISPRIKPQLNHLNLLNDWGTRQPIPKFALAHKPFRAQQFKPDSNKDDTNDDKSTGSGKSYDDDEDEEFMMTEDSVNEQPFAMQLRDPANYALAMHYKNSGQWGGIGGQQQHFPVNPTHWTQIADSENQFPMSGFGNMQRFQGYQHAQQQEGQDAQSDYEHEQQAQSNYGHEPQMTMKPPEKSTKSPNKKKSKKRKRLNMNRKVPSNYRYSAY